MQSKRIPVGIPNDYHLCHVNGSSMDNDPIVGDAQPWELGAISEHAPVSSSAIFPPSSSKAARCSGVSPAGPAAAQSHSYPLLIPHVSSKLTCNPRRKRQNHYFSINYERGTFSQHNRSVQPILNLKHLPEFRQVSNPCVLRKRLALQVLGVAKCMQPDVTHM